MDSESLQTLSPLPGILLSAFLLGLTLLVWPVFLGRLVSLNWRAGDMRPTAYTLQIIVGSMAAVAALARRKIDFLFAKSFPTGKSLLFAAIAFLTSVVLALGAAELALRAVDLPFRASKSRAETPLAQFDPELGWSYIPSRTVIQEFGLQHRKVAMHFDDLGCRVGSPEERHNPVAPTVLLVGDSYTFGHGVPYEESFAGRLAAMPDFPFQVVNLGVQAYGTDQALLILKRHFKKFRTKVVVYTFVDVHILRNATYDRRWINPHARFLGTKPQFDLKRDGTLFLSKRPVRYDDMSYSRLWALVGVVLTRSGQKPSLNLTRALVREMKNYVESNGAAFYVLNWDQGIYWDPPPTLANAQALFQGMNLNLIDTTVNAPQGWKTWIIPGNGHADARAHLHASQLIAQAIKSRK